MFHTFEGFENTGASTQPRGRGNDERQPSVSRRVTTLRACTSCRHRKIKCDGEKPCEACRWYKKADSCHYSDPRPSRRHVEKLSTTLDEYRSVLEKLFPSIAPETLVRLSREKLVELMGKPPSQAQHPASPATSASVEAHVSPSSNEDGNLESLQPMPEEPNDRSLGNRDHGLSDDVNALSLSARQPSSYLGVSSIHAVLKVIVWLDPGSISHFSRTPALAARRGSIPDYSSLESQSWQVRAAQQQPDTPPATHLQMSELQLLDAYFIWVQPFVPMLDEHSFRETYLSGRRKDDRWLALLNIVLCLGSLAACSAEDTSHQFYFQRCKNCLSLESLGSSNLETVQTLGLIGGYYLHYLSEPNFAYSLMGSTLRMAAALGLHKEFSDSQEGSNKQKISSMDLKRRTWWSLFCMDTWGGMTLGRPSMGRFGPTITVKPPNYGEAGSVLDILPLLENIRFCKIATQIQEVLAVAPLTKYVEVSNLDNQLLEWYENIPAVLKDHEPCTESINITRTVIRWRYYNQRMLLYRPTLLSYAMRRVPYIALRSEERTAIERCREIAEATIRDISSTAQLNQLSAWNATWFIFQAVLVPLLGLFLNDNTANDPRATSESCQEQVEIAMLLMARNRSWCHTAKRSLDALSRIYDASKRGPDIVGESNTLSTGVYAAGREGNVPGMVPGIAFSHADSSRGVMIANDGGVLDPSTSQFTDDSSGQHLWDFLSWSDTNIWPGFPGVENPNDANFLSPDEKNVKYGNNQPAFFGGQMADSGYFVNSSVSYF